MSAAADALMGIFGFKRAGSEMKTVEQTRRELFEAIWQEEMNAVEMDLCRFGKGYSCHETNRGWIVFNAALDAVEIELPSCFETFGEYSQEAALIATECCAEAIESTNLGIKVK